MKTKYLLSKPGKEEFYKQCSRQWSALFKFSFSASVRCAALVYRDTAPQLVHMEPWKKEKFM